MNTSAKPIRYLRFLWALPVLVMTGAALGKLFKVAPFVDNFRRLGVEELMLPLALIQLTTVVLFLIPRTRNIGFLLLCSFLGGIIATRWLNGAQLGPGIALEILLWVGMYFERPRLFFASPAPDEAATSATSAASQHGHPAAL